MSGVEGGDILEGTDIFPAKDALKRSEPHPGLAPGSEGVDRLFLYHGSYQPSGEGSSADRLVRSPWLDPGNVLRWLDLTRDHVRLAYQGTGSVEARAKAVIEAYGDVYPAFEEIRRRIGDVEDFVSSLREGLTALERAHEKHDRGPRTLRGHGCIVVKLVPCGKNCHGCPHGPYAYEVHKSGGKQVWRYLGRSDR